MAEVDQLIDKVRGRVYSRFRTHNEVEDLMQEASIYVWRKHTEHPDWDDRRIIYYGLMKAQSMVSKKSGEAPTGKPKNLAAKRKQVNGDASREKLGKYFKDYLALHNTKPSNSQAARDLGMSVRNVSYHMSRLHLFDTAVDKTTVKVYSLDGGLDADEPPAWMYHIPPVVVDYELHATRSEIREAISRLPERDRSYLYMEFWEDRTYVDIAKSLGVGGAYANKLRKQILSRLKEELTA